MGTAVSIHVVDGPMPTPCAVASVEEAFSLLHHLDEVFSLWKPDSPMTRIRDGRLALRDAPPEIGVALELCRSARELSEGWFDPWAMLGGVDPTGLVKGWAAELALAVLVRAGITGAVVNAGGDIVTIGQAPGGDPWRLGIRHPWRPDALACVVEVDSALATSGFYERGHHLQDPFEPLRVPETASASVTGPSLAMADALATAVAVAGRAGIGLIDRIEGYEAYVIMEDGSEEATGGFAFAADVVCSD
jgi:thiamine biosynthesis lipoprotein